MPQCNYNYSPGRCPNTIIAQGVAPMQYNIAQGYGIMPFQGDDNAKRPNGATLHNPGHHPGKLTRGITLGKCDNIANTPQRGNITQPGATPWANKTDYKNERQRSKMDWRNPRGLGGDKT